MGFEKIVLNIGEGNVHISSKTIRPWKFSRDFSYIGTWQIISKLFGRTSYLLRVKVRYRVWNILNYQI